MLKIKNIFLLTVLFLITNIDALAQGCAQCKAQIESSEDNGLSLGNGLNYGITLLMLSPYIIMFVIFRKQIFKFFSEFSGMWKK